MYALSIIAMVLLIIGALNWGAVGLSHYNAIERIFYFAPAVAHIIYVLIGLSGIYAIIFFGWFVGSDEFYERGREDSERHTPHVT